MIKPGSLVIGASKLGNNVVYVEPDDGSKTAGTLWSHDLCLVIACKPRIEHSEYGELFRHWYLLFWPREEKLVWSFEEALVHLP